MTTIAYRAGVMVGDGRETVIGDGESPVILRDNTVKVVKLPDGSLFGGAHSSEDISRLQKALTSNEPLPELDDIAGLRIDPKGRMWLYEGRVWQPLRGLEYFAIGSGSVFALAAMDAGVSALDAVKIAVKRDPYSGGKVTIVKLENHGRAQD